MFSSAVGKHQDGLAPETKMRIQTSITTIAMLLATSGCNNAAVDLPWYSIRVDEYRTSGESDTYI